MGGLLFLGIMMSVVELFLGVVYNAENSHDASVLASVSGGCALYGIGMIALCAYLTLYKHPFAYTDEQREKLKKIAIAMVVL